MERNELAADAKLVYNGDQRDLVALADKYGVTTRRLDYVRSNPEANSGPVFPTKSDEKEIQSKLYATIKSQLRDLGAN